MTFVKLEKLLDKSVAKAGIKKQVESVRILNNFSKVGEKFFGRQAMKKIKPLYLKNGTLTLACISSVLAEKIKAQERKVLEELNRSYKEKVVEKLRFLV